MNRGYIKVWRKIVDFDWYTEPNVLSLWITILIHANHVDKSWKGTPIPRGSFVTSLTKLSFYTGLSVQQTRTALDKLIATNNVTSKSTNKYRIITVVNYDTYQAEQQATQQTNNKPHNKQITTTNTLKEEKNERSKEKRVYKEYVRLTETEYEKLEEKLNGNLDKYLENLNNYIGSKGKRYKSHYHTILSWYNKDQKQTSPQRDTSHL